MPGEEERSEQRYAILRRIDGALGKVELLICDIGDHGLHVQHAAPVRLGTEAALRFSLPDSQISIQLNSVVVWSRFASPDDTRPYHSGLRVEDPEQHLLHSIDKLRATRSIRLDEESMARKRKALEEKARALRAPRLKQTGHAPQIPNDVILLVKQTRERLQTNPNEMVRWFNRAKYSLNEAGKQIHERDDVLAIWEYLERSIELDIIMRVLNGR